MVALNSVSDFCSSLIVDNYKRLAPRGRLALTPEAQSERDKLLLAWAMSPGLLEVAIAALSKASGLCLTQTVSTAEEFGQFVGSINARETLFKQQLYADPSLFVVDEVVPSRMSLARQQVLSSAIGIATEVISNFLQSSHGDSWPHVQKRLAVYRSALTLLELKQTIGSKPRRLHPREAEVRLALHGKNDHFKCAANSIRIYEGLLRLAPFALRQIVGVELLEVIGDQRALELACGLSLAEALSIASGHPVRWNLDYALDGIMASVGPLTVGWHKPLDLGATDAPLTISAREKRSGDCISFIRCYDVQQSEAENQSIRHATEILVSSCRAESKKGPKFEETPLNNCVVVIRGLRTNEPAISSNDSPMLTDFDSLTRGRLLALGHRIFRATQKI